ncbi:nitroreductase family protein [uncultured Anaerococcus sp.]|uniref:nitroreductase family protein n=1 Tax=uncultured Anaerococcus sp. TaxID=293428 RepID=UPI002608FF65|nr:nitroreductase family protein [uncultured Anaerococcus sp.]
MKTLDAFDKRRSYYYLDDNIKVDEKEIIDFVEEAVKIVPDAMGINTQNVIIVTGDAHKKLWDDIYDVYQGKVDRTKIDGFKAGYGTILFFYDETIIEENKKQYPFIEENFKPWAEQANGMLQITVWNGLTEMGLGVNLQHYNPVIDDMVRESFDVNPNHILLSQMVFGNIIADPEPKEKTIGNRVRIVK